MLVCSTRVSFNKAMEKKKQLRVTHRSNIIRDAWKLSVNVHRSRITRTRHVSHAHDRLTCTPCHLSPRISVANLLKHSALKQSSS